MHRSRPLKALSRLLVVLTAALPIAAQTTQDRTILAAWDDSLQAVKTLPEVERFRGSPATGDIAGLKRAMFELRAAELRGTSAGLQNVLSSILIDASKHGDWPWTSFALARAFAVLHRQGAPNGVWSGQLDGETLASTSWRFLAQMMKKDPTFARGREYFFNMLLATGERELHSDQLNPLMDEIKRPRPDARAWTVFGRVLRDRNQPDSSLTSFTKAVFAGADFSRLALERARSFRALNDTAGARISYWDGLERLSKAGREEYRYDLAWILTPDSVAMFDKVPDDSVLSWMHRFWDERDAVAANKFGERLQEHLRRWVYVINNFRVVAPWRKTDMKRVEMGFESVSPCMGANTTLYEYLEQLQPSHAGDIRDRERVIDHRGLIYLHHGAPLRTLGGGIYDSMTAGEGRKAIHLSERESMKNNISWLYWIEGKWRLLHFRGSEAIGTTAPTTLSSVLPMGNSNFYLDVATPELPEYFRAAQELMLYEDPDADPDALGPKACRDPMHSVVEKSREDSRIATTSDSDSPPLLDPWNGVIGMYALGHAREQNGKALLTFALPSQKMIDELNGENRRIWPVHFRIVAYDPKSGARVEIDTTRRFLAAFAPGETDFLTGWFELPLAAGTWQVSVKVNQQSDSSGLYSMHRELVVNNEPVLALSDVVPGLETARSWTAPDKDGFPVNALGTWPPRSTLDIYYEVRGVPDGESYKTTIQVREADSLGKRLIDLSSTDVSSGPLTTVRKKLALAALKAGNYLIVVTLESKGEAVVRKTQFIVTER